MQQLVAEFVGQAESGRGGRQAAVIGDKLAVENGPRAAQQGIAGRQRKHVEAVRR